MTHALERDLGFAVRAYDFELRSIDSSGRRLEGYVAVFNTRSRIPDRGGDFEEMIHPGFADRSLRDNGFPIMQFDHGKDPRVGTVPIGVYTDFDKDQRGYHVEGELFDNPVVEPVRQAIKGRAIKGMSFRFKVAKGGDKWERRHGSIDLRHVTDADVPEAGPVVFPAYSATTVSVRSLLATYSDEERDLMLRDLLEQAGLATDLTGQRSTRSARGGEYDAEPWEGEAPTSNTSTEARTRALAMRRAPIVLP
jgi:HK97 family phage prohead protease